MREVRKIFARIAAGLNSNRKRQTEKFEHFGGFFSRTRKKIFPVNDIENVFLSIYLSPNGVLVKDSE
ncbi:hypothetical protein CEXT_336061 [Caerostris extrusa]|uniref:Uncharacterized protein n=1 Tax=Caerostris extrusa TaxID=172846 RepID=A0AAV4SGT6_CAEEX|nr:hypothetical protein CEXT_336061 [Caerostris extrusa]